MAITLHRDRQRVADIFCCIAQGHARIVSYFICSCGMQRENGQHRQECGPGAQPRAEAPLSQANRETLAGNSDACGPRLKMKLFDIAGGGACSPRLEMKSFDIAGGGACGPRLKMSSLYIAGGGSCGPR